MVTQELIDIVTEKYQAGEKNAQIKEELAALGYEETDVDQTLKHIQHEALKQIPLVATIHQHFEHWDRRTAQLPPKKAAAILAACGVFVIVLAFGLYTWFDPLGTRNNARDNQRENDIITLRTSIERYYQNNRKYPANLNALLPDYITLLPTDPETKANYKYTVFNGGEGFQLCTTFESRGEECIDSGETNIPSIPVVITPTPEPTFSPEAGTATESAEEEITEESTEVVPTDDPSLAL